MNTIFWIKRSNKITAVKPARILFIKGNSYGCYIYYIPINKSSKEKVIISTSTLAYFESILKSYGFFRCHRNFLINPLLIDAFSDNESIIRLGQQKVPVSKRKRIELTNSDLKKIKPIATLQHVK